MIRQVNLRFWRKSMAECKKKEAHPQDLCLSQLAHIISISRRTHILGWDMLMLFVICESFLWMSNALLSTLQPLC